MSQTSDHSFQVAAMADIDGNCGPAYSDEDAAFYCVYALFDNGDVEVVSDFDTREEAQAFADQLNRS